MGCDFFHQVTRAAPTVFQSTHPVWGATSHTKPLSGTQAFQSTHPVWGATGRAGAPHRQQNISIHAPRVGCDVSHMATVDLDTDFNPRTPCGVRPGDGVMDCQSKKISIHAPRVGCDDVGGAAPGLPVEFQSTHPVWGATRNTYQAIRKLSMISIHAPRVGCDLRITF